jgi:hypothetical protein
MRYSLASACRRRSVASEPVISPLNKQREKIKDGVNGAQKTALRRRPVGPRSVARLPSTHSGLPHLAQAEVSLRSSWFHTAMAFEK